MDSMRDDLNAALDAAAEDDDSITYDETPQEVITDETEDTTETQTGEEEAVSTGEAEDTGAAPVEATGAGDEVAAEESAGNAGDSIKAPIDWGPQEREHWSKIPRNLQEKIMGREKEFSTLMESTAQARQTHEQFGQLANQYGAALSGVVGDTPMEAVGNLFNTVANLRMGSPIQKAQIITDLINDFGVDVATLDSALVGAAPPEGQQQNAEIERILNERLAPFEQAMGQQNAYQNQQHTQRTEAAQLEVQQFSEQAEFLQDVRMDMADLIDMADKRGQDMSMQEAYQKACLLNPQIQSILQQRAAQEKLAGNNSNMAGKRRAASSITGHRGGGGGGSTGNESMRDTLNNAWDSQHDG